MFSWHTCYFDCWFLAFLFRFDVDEYVVEEIEIVYGCECFAFFFGSGGGEMLFCVGGCYYGEVAAEGCFDFLVEMIAA
jgi:hypothetical protein